MAIGFIIHENADHQDIHIRGSQLFLNRQLDKIVWYKKSTLVDIMSLNYYVADMV